MSEFEPPKTPKVELEDPEKDKEIAELRDKVVDLESSDTEKFDKIKSLEIDLADREEKLEQLNQQVSNLLKENETLKANEEANKESIKDLEHRLSQKELELTRLEGSVEDLSIAKKKIEELQKEYKKLEEEMRAFQKIAENEPRFIILKDLQEFGEMRLNQISMKAGVSPAQAKRWLEELERAGLIEIHGEGRDSNPLVSKKN
ncbi:MAG: MarR family transcriptional regulator [Asgard group archaeon]|nr:MarR family transcriptional regulator [Asgard group archaeon]